MAWTRERYADVTGALITATPVAQVGGDSGFRPQAMQFNIRGRDLRELEDAAARLVAELSRIPAFVDLDTTYRGGKPELAIEIDRERAAALGVPVAAIGTTIRKDHGLSFMSSLQGVRRGGCAETLQAHPK